MSKDLWEAAGALQEERRMEDGWEGVLNELLGDYYGKVRSNELFEFLAVPSERRTSSATKRLGSVMNLLGWKREKLRFGQQHPQWCYSRGTPEQRTRQIEVGRDDASRPYPRYRGEDPHPGLPW